MDADHPQWERDELTFAHLPVRSAITKALVCKACGRILATLEAQESDCPG